MMIGDAISHIIQSDDATGALPLPLNASIAHLKVNGTASVATLAISNSTIDQTTRILRSVRSFGQIYGHRWTIVSAIPALSAFASAGDIRVEAADRFGKAI